MGGSPQATKAAACLLQHMPGALAEPGRLTEYGRIFPGDDDH
ncbi:MAG: hypothetical protein VCA35_09410 [Roseibacillus sp.]